MNPYEQLPRGAFWSPSIAQKPMLEIDGLWDPKFSISGETRVATFGSCFAQHIGAALKTRGYNWHVEEPAPTGMSAESAKRFNYDVFSARTGNVYTTSILGQWTAWAFGDASPPGEVWRSGDRFIDPFRPRIEPEGFESQAELLSSRTATLDALRRIIRSTDVFVFTMGLTESWFNQSDTYEYPLCPGTIAGEFDPASHAFVNQDYCFVRSALDAVIGRLRLENPAIRVVLTVSPVPLTATRSGHHVLIATMESKSILRAVAGSLCRQYDFVDYFPAYEIISSPVYKGSFFEPNLRSVTAVGVGHVMDVFFRSQEAKFGSFRPGSKQRGANAREQSISGDDVVCEEALLEAFAPPDPS